LSAASRQEALEELAAAADAGAGAGAAGSVQGTRSGARGGAGNESGGQEAGPSENETTWWSGNEEAGERGSLSTEEVKGLLALRQDWTG